MFKQIIIKISNVISIGISPRMLRGFNLFKSLLVTSVHKRQLRKTGKNLLIKSGSLIIGHEYISIGEDVSFGKDSVLTAWNSPNSYNSHPSIMIGNKCSFGDRTHITSINTIHIGSGVLTGRDVTITDNSHGENTISEIDVRPLERKLFSKGGVYIDDNVWIGDKATILPNVKIGKSCVIGSNSVVTKSFPDNVVIAGNPAKIIKKI